MLYEVDVQAGMPIEDAREVSHCVATMAHGVERLRGGVPLCMRLLREMHAVLMERTRGQAGPGEFRRSQVWTGGTWPQRGVRAAAGRRARRVPRPLRALRALSARRSRADAAARRLPWRMSSSRPSIPFSISMRPMRPLPSCCSVADGVLQEPLLYPSLFFKNAPAALLRAARQRSRDGRLGALARLLRRGRDGDRRAGGAHRERALARVSAGRDRIAVLGRAAPPPSRRTRRCNGSRSRRPRRCRGDRAVAGDGEQGARALARRRHRRGSQRPPARVRLRIGGMSS